jgi:phosphohistidine swiveling domain-containing protein
MGELARAAYAIEGHFGSPQDIEWLYDGNRFYVVQTRPITNINPKLHTLYRYIESESKDAHFYLERSGIAETYPRPTPLTYSILAELEKDHGPITQVYQELSIPHAALPTLKLCAGYLYTDKEAELQSFYPAYSYFSGTHIEARRIQLQGLFRSLATSYHLARITINPEQTTRLSAELEHLIASLAALQSTEMKPVWEQVVQAYKTIFKINMYSALLESRLRMALSKKDPPLVELLRLFPMIPSERSRAESVIGNSLAIEDETVFSSPSKPAGVHPETKAWWDALTTTQRNHIERTLLPLTNLVELRERARYATVWCAQHIRRAAYTWATQHGAPDPRLALFASLSEICTNTYIEPKLLQRKDSFEQSALLTPARVLATLPLPSTTDYTILSQGTGRGWYVDKAHLVEHADGRKYILKTDTLEPSLVHHFSQITGIITAQGSLLSHLAIMAREAGIPVVLDTQRVEPSDGSMEVFIDTNAYSRTPINTKDWH